MRYLLDVTDDGTSLVYATLPTSTGDVLRGHAGHFLNQVIDG